MRKILILTMLLALILSATTIGYCQTNIKIADANTVLHMLINPPNVIKGIVTMTLFPVLGVSTFGLLYYWIVCLHNESDKGFDVQV